MSTAFVSANELLTTVGATADPELFITLAAGVRYNISAQIEWSEVNGTDGGIQVGLSVSVAPTYFTWSASPDPQGLARASGSTIQYTGSTGTRLVTIKGTILPATACTVSVIRGLAQASGNPTTVYAGSFLDIVDFAGATPTPPTPPTPTPSGSYSYTLSNGEAVIAAYERIQIRAPEIRQEHMLTARRELNDLFVELSNRQVNLWKVELLSIDLVQGTATYEVPARVVMILDAYRSINEGLPQQTDIYMTPLSRTQYATIANKQTQGPPISYWFDRLITPTVTMWTVPDSGGPYVYNYYACSQLQDASLGSGQIPDLPYRWLGVLVTGLAKRLARVYAPQLEAPRKADFDEAWMFAATQDTENVPWTLAPNLGSYYRRY